MRKPSASTERDQLSRTSNSRNRPLPNCPTHASAWTGRPANCGDLQLIADVRGLGLGPDKAKKAVKVHGLDEVMVESGRFGPVAILLGSVGGDRDEGHHRKREIGTKPAGDLIAIKAGEPDIEQSDLRMKLRERP